MLGYKDNQSVKPSYGFYGETDIDNPDDQLVDWSKRYADHDSEELCHSSSEKKQHHSTALVNSDVNKQSDDELKRYYTEGTPTIASYSSSLNDLREIGISEPSSESMILKVQARKEHGFSPHIFPTGTPGSLKNCVNSKLVVNEIHASDEARKIESDKEEECVNQETEATFTKASSPLMFSRSSSVCSLNSFEQHSIVDDRSSVSAFSNFCSGIISPSEIPDSPGEVASPFVSKSKNSEFIFPSNDKAMDPDLDNLKNNSNGDFTDEVFQDFIEDDIKVYDDEGDCPSVSNLSALSIQANSTRVSISVIQCKNALVSLTQKSSVTVNCSITDTEADFMPNHHNLNISEEENNFKAVSGIPSDIETSNQSEKAQNIDAQYEDKGTSTSEDFNFHDTSYNRCSSPFKDKPTDLDYLQQNESADYSKDNSDDESDALLEECILNGMPSKDDLIRNISKQSLNHSFQTSESSLKDSIEAPNCSFSDDDISEDDDENNGMLKQCVLLGMPNKSNMQLKVEESSELKVSDCETTNKFPTSNGSSHQLELFDDAYESEMLAEEMQTNYKSYQENMDLVLPEAVSNQSFLKEDNLSSFNLTSHSNDEDDIKKESVKSDDDSDIDESDILVQQCIQLGMPKSQLRNSRNAKETKLPAIFPPNKDLGRRDNCPDGVSDGEDDDDDDMLKEIIKAGMPDSKSETNKSLYAESKSCLKSQTQRKITAGEDREMYLKKYYYDNIIPKDIVRTACASANAIMDVDDSTCVYRTEDTPILSPTASISDLSTLSFTEDKICQESFLNNSRNSDCSSESEDDELLRQCIRSGMPGARRIAA